MTVEEQLYQTTESLILPSPRTFYPARIPVNHPQLRSLISSPAPGIFYYAYHSDLFRLDIIARRQELVTSLPFSARCLVAGYGWLCVGGADNGQFAAIRIEDGRSSSRFADIEHLLPRQLPPEIRAHRFLLSLEDRAESAPRRKPEVRIHEFGGYITNSVTLYQAPLGSAGAEDGPVAVLSNNDKTIRLFSLLKNRLLATLDFPLQMNHATIRPDGEMLLAVGDDAYAYFFQRIMHDGIQATNRFAGRSLNHPSWQWQLQRRYDLTRAPDPTNDGCFATAFSPSGQYCAVASQDGIITVFNTDYINSTGNDAIIEVLPSSRPHPSTGGEGAIRSICFSPAPWDLLICAEQSGRICVIDMRSRFRLRQLVNLVPESDMVVKAEIHDDSSPEELIDPRLRNNTELEFVRQYRETMALRDAAAVAEFAADYFGASAERRRLQRHARNESPPPSIERERQILDALRTSRERIEAREQVPANGSYLLGRDSRESSSLLSQGDPEGLTGAASATTIAAAALRRERNRERNRTHEPHRRNSVVLAGNESRIGDSVLESAEVMPTFSAEPLSSSLEYEPRPRPERDASRRITTSRRYQTMLEELERNNVRRLDAARRERVIELYTEVEGTGRHAGESFTWTESESHLGTTGCLMSGDGRRLYVGTEEGLFELHVNIQYRKFYPRISLR